MPTHETIYDFLAHRFRQLGAPEYPLSRIVLDAEREGFGDIYEVSHIAIYNALQARGLEVSHGVVRFPQVDGEHFDPVATDYARFTEAAAAIVKAAERPVATHNLLAQIGLPKAAVPYAAMAQYLHPAGIFHIPGVGYWRSPQWTMPDGRIITKRIKSARAEELRRVFEREGWPITGRETEEQTAGIVTARWLTAYAQTKSLVAGMGSGLYVPRDLVTKDVPLPLSTNIAQAFADLDPDAVINDKDHFRLFRIALAAARLDWVAVHKSRTTKAGVRVQTMRLEWTPSGLVQIRRAIHRTADVF